MLKAIGTNIQNNQRILLVKRPIMTHFAQLKNSRRWRRAHRAVLSESNAKPSLNGALCSSRFNRESA